MARFFEHLCLSHAKGSFLNLLAIRNLTIGCQIRSQKFTLARSRGRSARLAKQYFKPDMGIKNALETMEDDAKGRNVRSLAQEMHDDDEEDYDQHILNAHHVYDQNADEANAWRKRVNNKIIERKYFKEEPEPKLVSWAAMEQIRYLHEMDPNEWTPEKLAESFPISVNGVKKLLKSNFRIETEERRIKHDKMVLNNWKQLRLGQGPLSAEVIERERYLTTGFEHIDGSKALPKPDDDWRAKREMVAGPLPSGENPGEFELMVVKLPVKSTKKPDVELIKDKSYSQQLFDPSISDVGKRKSSKPVSFEEFKQNLRNDLFKYTKDVPRMQAQVKRWMNEEGEKTGSSKIELPEHGDDKLERENRILELFEGKMQKFNDSDVDVKWDISRKGTVKEAYIYEAKTGYQHPYGRSAESQNIEIPENQRISGKIYRKNDCFYDEDGEFLYRLPFEIDQQQT